MTTWNSFRLYKAKKNIIYGMNSPWYERSVRRITNSPATAVKKVNIAI